MTNDTNDGLDMPLFEIIGAGTSDFSMGTGSSAAVFSHSRQL
jgi:hypothetical protein